MANTEVGSAYISIYANLSRKFGSGIDSAVKSAGKAFSGLATKAGLAAAAAGGAVATGLTAIGKMALDSYAQYEQLAGGVEKIFDQADISQIMQDAQSAYRDLNMSANQYLESINQVGATFAQTMGDQKGYDTARTGMKAIADYASGTGRSVDELNEKFSLITRSTSSYQSIADQFSGILPATSADFLEQAQAAGILSDEYTSLTEVPIAEYQEAVSLMLEKGVDDMGLLGNTAAESTETITGSIAMTQAAWQNLLTELGKDDGDVTARVEELMESVTAVVSNVTPVVQRIGEGLAAAMPELVPAALELGGQIVMTIGQAVIESAPVIATSIGQALQEAWASIPMPEGVREQFEGIFQTISDIASGAASALQGLAPHFMPILDSLQRMGETLLPLVQPLLEHLAQTASEHLMPALEYLGDALSYLFEQAEPWMPHLVNVAAIIGDMLIVSLSALVDAIGIVANIVGTVLEAGMAFSDFIEGLPEGIGGAAESIGGFFSGLDEDVCNAIDSAGSTIDGWASDVKTWFGNVASDVDGATSNMCESIGAWANDIGNDARQAGEDFYNGVTERFDAAKDAIEGIPDQIIGFFSGLGDRVTSAIGSIHFPQPSIWFEHVGIGDLSIPIPHVDWYAQGAWFKPNNPVVMAGFGDNTRYDEVALPLSPSNLASIGTGIAKASDFRGGDGGGVDIHDCTFVVRREDDIRKVAVQLNTLINRQTAGGIA